MKLNLFAVGATIVSLFGYIPVCTAQSSAFSYQGRLNVSGVPVSGLYDLQFTIYGSAIAGPAVSAPLTNSPILVSNGLFAVTLNFGSGVFNGADRWLEIGARPTGVPSPFTILSPRQQILTTPYAVRAANLSGTITSAQITGSVPASQLGGTLNDAQLSTNVALVNGNQTFSGANNFTSGNNTFVGNGAGITGINANQITDGILDGGRLPDNVAKLTGCQNFTDDEGTGPALKLVGQGTNNWIIISNGAIFLPPFALPNEEDGADAIRGGIYFASAGNTGPNIGNNHYILNLVHRGTPGGQLLLSHDNIVLEENLGLITLGNDGNDGGAILIRYDDAFGTHVSQGQKGHAKPLIFSARTKDAAGTLYSAYAAIVAFHGGTPVNYPGGYALGTGGLAELHFYSKSPDPVVGGLDETNAKEMGRMETNGWNFKGTMTYQKSTVSVNTGTNYVLDFGTNHYIEINLNTSPVRFTTTNPHGGSNNVQKVTLILHAGSNSRQVTFPPWKVVSESGTAVLPTNLAALTTTVVRLEILGDGGDTQTLAKFERYSN